MKNWERILEDYQKEGYNTIYKLYNKIPKFIIKEVVNDWDYAHYDTEAEQFAHNFISQLGSFLYIIKHYSGEELEKLGLCNYDTYSHSYRRTKANKNRGTVNFERWLCTEESPYNEIPTQHREIYLGGSIAVDRNSNISLDAAFKMMDKIKNAKSFAYLMYLYQNEDVSENSAYLKVGKTSNIRQRQNQLKKQYNLKRIEVIKLFDFSSEEGAEMMESFMRKFYKAKYPDAFTPKDRFKGGVCSDEELAYFEKKAKLIAAAAEI